jgi:hypothetical protein
VDEAEAEADVDADPVACVDEPDAVDEGVALDDSDEEAVPDAELLAL